MPIRFAASLHRTCCRMPRTSVQTMHLRPANDNRARHVASLHLKAALRHFARHGLAAAENARQQAVAAAKAGDRESFEWWLEICRALDRRMANAIDESASAGA